MFTRRQMAAALAILTAGPAQGRENDADRFRDALERIALMDEADGHELNVRHAFRAVAIATHALGDKHPSQILVEREARKR